MSILFDLPPALAASFGPHRHDIATASSRLVVQQTRHPDYSLLAGLPALLVYRLPGDISDTDSHFAPILDREKLLKALSEDSAEAATLAALREAVGEMYAAGRDFHTWEPAYRRACASCGFDVAESDIAALQAHYAKLLEKVDCTTEH